MLWIATASVSRCFKPWAYAPALGTFVPLINPALLSLTVPGCEGPSFRLSVASHGPFRDPCALSDTRHLGSIPFAECHGAGRACQGKRCEINATSLPPCLGAVPGIRFSTPRLLLSAAQLAPHLAELLRGSEAAPDRLRRSVGPSCRGRAKLWAVCCKCMTHKGIGHYSVYCIHCKYSRSGLAKCNDSCRIQEYLIRFMFGFRGAGYGFGFGLHDSGPRLRIKITLYVVVYQGFRDVVA